MQAQEKFVEQNEDQYTENHSDTTSQIVSLANNNIKNLICHFNIDTKNLNYIQFLSNIPRYVRSFFVSTLPRFIVFGDFLKNFYRFGNINTSILINPINRGIAQTNLSSIIKDFEEEILEAAKTQNTDKQNAILQKKMEAENLRDEIASKFNTLFEVSILSSVFAKSPEELDIFSNHLAFETSKTMVNIKSAWAQQGEAFRTNLPYGCNKFTRNNTFDTFATSAIFPFVSSNTSHPSGVPIGMNKQTGLPVFLDDFYPTLSNHNFIIFGRNSSGKHTTVNILASRSYVMANVQNVALDTYGRYSKVAEFLDGINVPLTSNSKTRINPFEIEPETSSDEITGREISILNIKNKIEDVTNILFTMARGSIKSQYVNDTTRKIIKETIEQEYKASGITNDPESIYSSQGANLIGTKIIRNKKDMPTMGSWYKRLTAQAQANSNPEYKYHYEYLLKYMKDYVSELGGKIPYFDGQSNIDLPLDASFINFDLSKLDENFLKPLTTQVLLSFIWEKYVKSNSEEKSKAQKKRIIFDEASIMFSYSEAVDFLNTISQRVLKKNTSLLIVSKKCKEFYDNPKLKNLLSSSGIKFLMNQDKSEIEDVVKTFNLTKGERDFLANCSKGEGIFKIDNDSAQIYVPITDYELELME